MEQIKTTTTHRGENKRARYMQLLLLTVAGGAIYPMLYMRQIYQTTMLEAFQITNGQLGEMYSLLGLLFFLSYAPSGWLADKIQPMKLIALSLLGTGLLGFWYSTLPDYPALLTIYAGWGITTGLTFWGAVMKRIKLLAGENESGRFYGFYEGGRGLVEALLASVALSIFALVAGEASRNVVTALVYVIYMYSWLCVALALFCIVGIWLENQQEKQTPTTASVNTKTLLTDILLILKQPEVWLISLIIAAGFHLFWATYSFSAYLQEGNWGFTAVMAGAITTIKLWLRPVGGALGGILGDKFNNIRVLNLALAGSALGLLGMIVVPQLAISQSIIIALCIFFILWVGLLTYAIRGLYWAIIENLRIAESKLGLAIGIISVLGYCPDIFIPLINGYIMDSAPSQQAGFQLYFSYIIATTLVGMVACFILKKRTEHDRSGESHAHDPASQA